MFTDTELAEALSRLFAREIAEDDPLVDQFNDADTLEQALRTAATSPEAQNVREVISFYQVFLGRLPDQAGLEFNVQALDALPEDATAQQRANAVEALTQAFVSSPEFEDQVAGRSVEAVVREFYVNNLDRDPLSLNPVTGELSDLAGFEFWRDTTQSRIEQGVADGLSESEAELAAYQQLAIDFALATETQDVVFTDFITNLLVNNGLGNAELPVNGDQPPFPTLFDVEGQFFPVSEQVTPVRWQVDLSSAPNLEDGSAEDFGQPLTAVGNQDATDALILTGDASVRIDMTDPFQQVEGIDIDGSADGVLDPDEVHDGITFSEQDLAFREQVTVQHFEIFSGHPFTDQALLNPAFDDEAFTGNIYFDGTGFDGDGRATDGNIVLGGWGEDTIFTGNGNDFITTHALNDTVKAGRNADFIYQELSTLDDRFSGDDQEVDGGATFDTDEGQDTDWLLLEASDDEEPVTVRLADESGDEDNGSVTTRLENDAIEEGNLNNIENLNASGNFYKFLDIGTDDEVSQIQPLAFFGAGTFVEETVDEFYNDVLSFSVNLAGAGSLDVTGEEIAGFDVENVDPAILTEIEETFAEFDTDNDPATDNGINTNDDGIAGVQSFDEMFILAYSKFNGQDDITVRPGTDVADIEPITDLTITDNGPIIIFEDGNAGRGFAPVANADTQQQAVTFNIAPPGDDNIEAEARGFAPIQQEVDPGQDLLPDLFFGDNRDFSEIAVEFRVPNLSPGVTAQMVVSGSSENNTVIAGYDNDSVEGLAGDDLLFGGDLEFLLTHRHNPNLFDVTDGTVSVNTEDDGVADVGRDTLIGGEGDDNLVWDAAAGDFIGDTGGAAGDEEITNPATMALGGYPDTPGGGDGKGDTNPYGEDTLWVTAFSIGRTDEVARSTDGSIDPKFTATDGAGNQAAQDLLGDAEADEEADAAEALTTDSVLRFDLAVGWGQDFQGDGADIGINGNPIGIDLAGADRDGTADQTNYVDDEYATTVTDIENANLSGYGAIDYRAAGTNDPELNFENQQNFRGTNLDADLRGVDTDFQSEEPGGPGEDFVRQSDVNDLDFTLDQLLSDFNVFSLGKDGAPLQPLVYTASNTGGDARDADGAVTGGNAAFDGDFTVKEGTAADVDIADYRLPDALTDVQTPSENKLYGGAGDDTIEGRGGDDWLAGFTGDDSFIVSLNDGDNVAGGSGYDNGDGPTNGDHRGDGPYRLNGTSQDIQEAWDSQQQTIFGDNVNLIARLRDSDADGLADASGGRYILQRDFRPGETETTALKTVQLDVTGDLNIDDAPDNWGPVQEIVLLDSDNTPIGDPIDVSGAANATQVASILASELPADLNFSVSAGGSDVPADDEEFDGGPGGQLDSVNITFDVNNPLQVANFTASVVAAGEGVDRGVEPRAIETPPDIDFVPEDDDVVFRSYQNRLDDESTPDQQASLGLESYAEDLVVGVENGSTKLVEGQKYNVLVDDLKDGDVFSLTLNHRTYELTVGIDPVTGEDIEGESTEDFLERFADYVNTEISMDKHSLDGQVGIKAFDADQGAGGENIHGLMIREITKGVDEAEHVYIKFPQVSVNNFSGGDAPSVVVKEVSDTTVALYDYDFRNEPGATDASLATDGLNRGVDHRTDRGPAIDDRFITFEDTTGLNRAILQNAANAGEQVEGLHVLTFAAETDFDQPDGAALDADFEGEVNLEDVIGDQDPADDEAAYLAPIDFGDPSGNVGNGRGQIGQPGEGQYEAIHGDDLLIGGLGVDTLLGYTGDDRLMGSKNSDDEFQAVYDGGVNLVVDQATGQVVEAGNPSGLAQAAGAGQELETFKDALILQASGEEGSDADSEVYEKNSRFVVAVTGAAIDGGLDAQLSVFDPDGDAVVDHTATIRNMEVIRSLNQRQEDTLDFSALGSGVSYDNQSGPAPLNGPGDMGFVSFDGTMAGMVQVMGFETVIGTDQDDELLGGSQAENLQGNAGNDTIDGGLKDDTITGGKGDDSLLGGKGDDEIAGGEGMDTAFGGDGDDVIAGGAGMDQLFGGKGDDDISGGGGYDVLSGGDGADTVLGNGGQDVFLVTSDGDADSIDGGTGQTYIHYDDEDPNTLPQNSDADTLNGGTDPDDTLLQITDFGKSPEVTITFTGDDEDGDNESVTIDLIGLSGVVNYKATETIDLGAVSDMTQGSEIALAVFDALDTRGYTVSRSGNQVTINDVPGGTGSVFLNDVTFDDPGGDQGSDLVDIGAVWNQGAGLTVDLSDAVGNADRFAFNGASTVYMSPATIGSVFIGTPGQNLIIEPEAGSSDLTNPFDNDDLTSTSTGLATGRTTVLRGDDGDNVISDNMDAWNTQLEGLGGDDSLVGNDGNDRLLGGSGNDTADGGTGSDTAEGGEGDDVLNGDGGPDDLYGGSGNDELNGGEFTDELFGGTGNDTASGGGGRDEIFGGEGDDELSGNADRDEIYGGDGDDLIFGGDETEPGMGQVIDVPGDSLFGGDGNDTINGGRGDDLIEGGLGGDTLTGGSGEDEFHYDLTGLSLGGTGNDIGEDESRVTEGTPDEVTDFDAQDGSGGIVDQFVFTALQNAGLLFGGQVTTTQSPHSLPVETDLSSLGISNPALGEVYAIRNGTEALVIANLEDAANISQQDLRIHVTLTEDEQFLDGNFGLGMSLTTTADDVDSNAGNDPDPFDTTVLEDNVVETKTGTPNVVTPYDDIIIIPDNAHLEDSTLNGGAGDDDVRLTENANYDLSTNNDDQGPVNEPASVGSLGGTLFLDGSNTDVRVDQNAVNEFDTIAGAGVDNDIYAESTDFRGTDLSGIDDLIFAGGSSQDILVDEQNLGGIQRVQANDSDSPFNVDLEVYGSGDVDIRTKIAGFGQKGVSDIDLEQGDALVIGGDAQFTSNGNAQSDIELDDNVGGDLKTSADVNLNNFIDVEGFADVRSLNQGGSAGVDIIDETFGIGRSLYGDQGSNELRGNGGADNLLGFGGDDFLYGGSGNDDLFGGKGDDELFGGRGDDELEGGFGQDLLEGGKGDDVLTGGDSPDLVRDAFNMTNRLKNDFDLITDFEPDGTTQSSGPDGDFVNIDPDLVELDGDDDFGSSASYIEFDASAVGALDLNSTGPDPNAGAEVIAITGVNLTGDLSFSVTDDDRDGTNFLSAMDQGGFSNIAVDDGDTFVFLMEDSSGNTAVYFGEDADDSGFIGGSGSTQDIDELDLLAVLEGVTIDQLDEDNFRNSEPTDGDFFTV